MKVCVGHAYLGTYLRGRYVRTYLPPLPLRASSICCTVSSLTPLKWQRRRNQHIGNVWLQYSEDCTPWEDPLVQCTQEGLHNNMFVTLCILCKSHVYHSMTGIARLHSGINKVKLYLAVLTLVHSLTPLLLLGNTSQQHVCNTSYRANHMFIPAVIRMTAPLSCLEPQHL